MYTFYLLAMAIITTASAKWVQVKIGDGAYPKSGKAFAHNVHFSR